MEAAGTGGPPPAAGPTGGEGRAVGPADDRLPADGRGRRSHRPQVMPDFL